MTRTKITRGVAALALAWVTVGIGGTAASAQERPTPTPEEKAAALIRPAVLYVEMHWSGFVIDEDGVVYNDGKPYEYVTRCTGFVVNPTGSVVTAGHCVDDTASSSGARRDFIRLAVQEALEKETYQNNPSAEQLFDFGLANWKVEGQAKDTPPDRQVFVQRGVAAANQKGGDTLPARVVDFRTFEQGDVALLKVEKSDLPAAEVASSSGIEIGTRVLAVGYPGSTDEVTDTSLEPTNKDGSVNAKKTVGSIPFYEISAAMSGGMSGGPTVDLQGRVIGINSFSPSGETEAFNFIAPSSLVSEILTKNGVKNEIGRNDTIYRQGLNEYFTGRYTASIKTFDRVLALDPSHQQAQEYRQKAAKAKAEGLEGESGMPVLPIAIGVGVLAAIIVAVVVLRGRGGRATTSAPAPEPAIVGAPPAAAAPHGAASPPPGAVPEPSAPSAPVGFAGSSSPAPAAPTYTPPPPAASTPQPAASTPSPAASTPSPAASTPSPAIPEPSAPPVSPTSYVSTDAAPAASASTESPAEPTSAGSDVAFCPNCGAARAEDAQFCAKCGNRF